MRGYLNEKFKTHRIIKFGDITETVIGIYAEEIGNLGLPVPGASSTVSRKGVHWTAPFEEIYLYIQSDIEDSKF